MFIYEKRVALSDLNKKEIEGWIIFEILSDVVVFPEIYVHILLNVTEYYAHEFLIASVIIKL